MKRLLDPGEPRSFGDRGTVRTPDGLARYLDGRRGNQSLLGVYPHGRYQLWMEMWCHTLAAERYPYDFVDLQVGTFYRGVLPWLGYGLGDPAGTARATDLVDLVDELMDNEGRWYAYAAAWPLRDVLAVFADVFTTLYLEPLRDLLVAWDLPTREWLIRQFGEVVRAIETHEDCCAEVRVNVHWW